MNKPQVNKPQRGKRRYMPVIIGFSVAVVGVGAIAFVRGIITGAPPQAKKVVQEIHIVRPPPPPPDLPPPPPPPPDEKIDVPDPQSKPDPTPSNEPPPGEQLGLDAEGSAGGDAFGLLGNKGGRDLVASGGSAFAWYAGVLKNEILDKLGPEKRSRSGSYSIDVRIWVRDDGTIDHVRLVQSSGDHERDREIEAALNRITRLSQPPPAGMPEPISLRIVSRG